jgi:hypothetical protein
VNSVSILNVKRTAMVKEGIKSKMPSVGGSEKAPMKKKADKKSAPPAIVGPAVKLSRYTLA